MNQADFIRLVAQRPQNYGWFLGAGSSRSAGLPTATDVIWDLKRRYYRSEESQDILVQDMQNPAVQARIQAFLDSRGFPAQWAPDEYSIYFDKIFGDDKERQRQYIQGMLSEERVSLSVGSRALGAMMASGFTRILFTTNFDTVVEKAVAEVSGRSQSAYHLEGAHNAKRALDNEEYPLYCKLHGDFRFDSIKNLSSNLLKQNTELSECFINAGNRFGFIVAGYSGRDQSVMALFHQVLESSNPFPHGLYWTGIKGAGVSSEVESLLERARSKGIAAEYVEIETFDTLLVRIWRNLDNKPPELDAKVRRSSLALTSIPLPPAGGTTPVMRFNAVPLLLPDQCMALELTKTLDWSELRSILNADGKSLIGTKGDKVWCWGLEANVRTAFGDNLISITPQIVPTDFEASGAFHAKAFVEDALSLALTRDKPLLARNMRYATWLIANPSSASATLLRPLQEVVEEVSGTIRGLTISGIDGNAPEPVTWVEGARISLDIRHGKAWLIIEPDVWIWPTRARRDAADFLDKRRSNRYNKKYNELLDAWTTILVGTDRANNFRASPFEGGSAIENPVFEIGTRSAFSRKATA